MKQDIIDNGIYSMFLKQKKELYEKGFGTYNKENYKDNFDTNTVDLCFKIYNSTKARKNYTLNEILKWYFVIENIRHYKDYKLIFGTLTFNDKKMESTSEITRRRYVARFLKENTECYIANIDFGKTNNREHYHFIALVEKDIKKGSFKNGYDYYDKINLAKNDLRNIKNYLLKLNNHSYKDTTRQKRIIMNKRKDKIDMIEYLINIYNDEFFKFKANFFA